MMLGVLGTDPFTKPYPLTEKVADIQLTILAVRGSEFVNTSKIGGLLSKGLNKHLIFLLSNTNNFLKQASTSIGMRILLYLHRPLDF